MKRVRCFTVVVALGGMGSLMSMVCPAQTPVAAKTESAASAASSAKYVPPKTAWGDPDLQGIWTSDDLHDVPMQRPARFPH